MNQNYYVGIDIGGTKTALALYDETFSLVVERTMATDCQNGCRALVEQIHRLYEEMLSEAAVSENEVRSIGVCSPGPLDLEKGSIVFIPTMGFRNEPLRAYFEEIFHKPIALQNDANAAALGEAVFGEGRGKQSVVYITVSTGIGCGIVLDGRIYDGRFFAAGELGHMKVKRGGRPCVCGGKGCLEAYASGTAIAAISGELTGQPCRAKEVFAGARWGEEPYRSVVVRAGDYLGFALGAVYQILDPDVVILGGSVTKDWDVWEPILKESLDRYCEAVEGRSPVLLRSNLDGKQGILGAAWLGKSM